MWKARSDHALDLVSQLIVLYGLIFGRRDEDTEVPQGILASAAQSVFPNLILAMRSAEMSACTRGLRQDSNSNTRHSECVGRMYSS